MKTSAFVSAVVCDKLVDPENGEVTYSGEMGVGEMAIFDCNSGYKLQGTSPLVCVDDGHWNGTTDATCVPDAASK